ncbi:MAG: TIGR00341 family protein [Acidimicrobiales bacterium]|nr:TIGR00341 family protein [Acidimicrobiales bacterium]
MARDERARVVANLFHEGGRRRPFVHRFAALMVLSSLIAVLGLLADSTAVVIGAMIVAPLMAPVLGVAAAIVMDWPRRAAESAATATLGSAMAIALAVAAAAVLPSPEEIPGEVLARTAPNLLDLGVAVSAGAAGAYAQVRRAAGEALTGVAVAVALVPPLAVVGITLQMGEWTLAAGAFLLFLANVAGIVLAAAGTFMLCGLAPRRQLISGRINVARGFRLAAAAVLLIVAPLEMTDQWRERRPINEDETRSAVKVVLEETNPDAAVISIEVDTEDGERTIDITASTSEEPIDVGDLAENLSEELDVGFELEVTTLEADSQSATVEESEEGDADIAVEETDEASNGDSASREAEPDGDQAPAEGG